MRERRLRLSKIGNVGLWTAVILGFMVVGGSSVYRYVTQWLVEQPAYSLSYRDIELDPSPPKWIKSGRIGLLEQVRASRPSLANFSAVGFDLDELIIDFKKLAWISAVVRATKSYPNKVTVSLAYREPVARVSAGRAFFYIDAESVVLPEDDLDLDKAGRLFDIVAEPPREPPKPGLAWPGDLNEPKNSKLNPQIRVELAAKLAGYLKHQTADLNSDAKPPYLPITLNANHDTDLFVQLANGTAVLWSALSTTPLSTEPSNDQKWAWLLELSRTENGLAIKRPEFLDLSGDAPRLGRFSTQESKQ